MSVFTKEPEVITRRGKAVSVIVPIKACLRGGGWWIPASREAAENPYRCRTGR